MSKGRNYHPARTAEIERRGVPGIEMVALDSLNVDMSYQRPNSPMHVARLTANFSLAACGAIQLSRRADGSLWIIDGYNRVTAARRHGITHLPATITTGLTVQEEAARFVETQSGVWKMNARDFFRAALEAGDPVAAECARVVGEAGLALNYVAGKTADSVRCFGALLKAQREHGSDVLLKALQISTLAWPQDYRGRDADMVVALCAIVGRFGDRIDTVEFADKMSRFSTFGLRQAAAALKAATRDSGDRCRRMAILQSYNKGRSKNRLDWEVEP